MLTLAANGFPFNDRVGLLLLYLNMEARPKEETSRYLSIAVGDPTDRVQAASPSEQNPTILTDFPPSVEESFYVCERPEECPKFKTKLLKDVFKCKLTPGQRGTSLCRQQHKQLLNRTIANPKYQIYNKIISNNQLPEDTDLEKLNMYEEEIKELNVCELVEFAGMQDSKSVSIKESERTISCFKIYINQTPVLIPTHLGKYCEKEICVLCSLEDRVQRENLFMQRNFMEALKKLELKFSEIEEEIKEAYQDKIDIAYNKSIVKLYLKSEIQPIVNEYARKINQSREVSEQYAYCSRCGTLNEEELLNFHREFLCLKCALKFDEELFRYEQVGIRNHLCHLCGNINDEVCINGWCIWSTGNAVSPRAKYRTFLHGITEKIASTPQGKFIYTEESSHKKKTSKFNYINSDNPLGFLSLILWNDGREILGLNNDVSNPKWIPRGYGKYINEVLDFKRPIKVLENNEDLIVYQVPEKTIRKYMNLYNNFIDENLTDYPHYSKGKQGLRGHILFSQKEYSFGRETIKPSAKNIFQNQMRSDFGLNYSFNACLAVTYFDDAGLNLHKDDEPIHLDDQVFCLTLRGEGAVQISYGTNHPKNMIIETQKIIAYKFKNQNKFKHGVLKTSNQRIALTFRNFKI